MKENFHFWLFLACFFTARAIWCVGFSRRWSERAMKDLEEEFGRGPNDDFWVECARRTIVTGWVVASAAAWFMASQSLRTPS